MENELLKLSIQLEEIERLMGLLTLTLNDVRSVLVR